ncbi:MAG: hypothetical protein II187_11555 [Treponema sp.]|jgi:hypothetical protein|nr:hypothetical protein [Treponema sp.]
MTDTKLLIRRRVEETRRMKEKRRLEADFSSITAAIRQRNRNILKEKMQFRSKKTENDSGSLSEEFHKFFRIEYAVKALSLGIRREDVQKIFLLSPDELRALEGA